MVAVTQYHAGREPGNLDKRGRSLTGTVLQTLRGEFDRVTVVEIARPNEQTGETASQSRLSSRSSQ